jgi:hypothetical protein
LDVIKASAIALNQGRMPVRRRRVAVRLLALMAAAFALGLSDLVAAAQPQLGQTVMPCSNPASGASWQIMIDFDRHTVDGYPAAITDSAISWRDPRDQGNYTLDRKSGNLRVAVPSSTGGYFLHDQCKLDK